MAHFYGEISGNRGAATRMGSKDSGFRAHIRGWHVGVRVYCEHNKETGEDEIYVYQTGGSSEYGQERLITKIVEGQNEEAI